METIGLPPITVAVFCVAVVFLLVADISNHRKGRPISLRSASLWSILYIAAALVFSGYLYYVHGKESASLFLTGYTLEKALAFDNLFVFSMIFAYFKIPSGDQHSALHWGIIGAIVFRLIFVVLGVTSMGLFGPIMELIFAALIVLSVWMIINSKDEEADYNNAWYIKSLKKVWPSVTPFMVSIVAIEISDIMFSFDSVPAVIAVTKDPLLIYSAMIFAILGLRSLYFVIEALTRFLVYMDTAIVVVLMFIALKLSAHAITGFHIEPTTSLIIVLTIISTGVLTSLIKGEQNA